MTLLTNEAWSFLLSKSQTFNSSFSQLLLLLLLLLFPAPSFDHLPEE